MGLIGRTRERAGALRAPARPSSLSLYVSAVAAAGAAVLAVVLLHGTWWAAFVELPALLVLVAAIVLGEIRPIPISRGGDHEDSITTSTAFVLALMVVGGIGPAALATVVSEVVDGIRKKSGPLKVVFNIGQYVLSLTAARLVFCSLTGEPFTGGVVHAHAEVLLPTLVASLAFVAVNHTLVAAVIALATHQPLRRMLVEDLRFSMTVQGVLAAVAPLAAFGVQDSWVLPVLLGAPIVGIYVSAREAMRREHEALHDSLTGLANRQLLLRRLSRELERSEGQPTGPALILFDLDHFKDVNDTLGHPVGDVLLVEVAGRLREVVGYDGTVARLGGDEFAVLVPGGLDAAQGLAQAVLRALEVPVVAGDLRLLVQASAGIAGATRSGGGPSLMLKQADIALYDAKMDRGRASVYSPESDVNSVERLQLLADLRLAMDARSLSVVFQPQVSLADRRVSGAEVLVRWDHPTRGMVPPDLFVPLAENSGLIGQLTSYVLDEGLAASARLRAQGHDIRIAVNMSARHMSDLALPGSVAAALVRHGVPASRLVLEVTETGILSDPVRVDAVVSELKELGVSIAVDDYGTGNASLSYLKRLDVDELKVDRSFVRGMRQETNDFIIVRSTVALARDLGLRVVAEGIEDEETCLSLEALGCDTGQGYHLGRPASESELAALLDGGPVGARVPEQAPDRSSDCSSDCSSHSPSARSSARNAVEV